jgi:hypothetical protein
MTQRLSLFISGMILFGSAFAAEKGGGVLEGDIKKLDAGAKTAVVKTADGTEHTIHFVDRTAVHGADSTAAGAKDTFHGLKEGSHVAVHYTAKGAEKTADEVDDIGKDGLKASEATVVHIDRGVKTLAVKTADGAEETSKMTDKAARHAGNDIAKDSEKGGKVTVYYTEEGGKKLVHFFKKAA